MRSRLADAIGVSLLTVLLLCPGVTATPPWPLFTTPIADSQATTRIIAFDLKLGHEIGHQQGQKRLHYGFETKSEKPRPN
jgi:hypothetical protein